MSQVYKVDNEKQFMLDCAVKKAVAEPYCNNYDDPKST